MKTKSQISPSLPRLVSSAFVASLSFAGPVAAADLTWDNIAGDSIVTGGAGTWDTSLSNWTTDAGLTNLAWDNLNNDVALFGDVPGIVTLGAPITASGLVFSAAGYSVTGSTLTLTGASNVTVGSGLDAAISSVIDGTAGLVAGTAATGTGTLTLAGANLYTGTTLVNAGTVNIQNGGAFGGTAEGTSVANGAGLSLEGGVQVLGESLSIRGAGVGSAGAIRNISGDNSWTGLITLTNSLRVTSNSGTLTLGSASIAQRTFIMTGPGNITVEGDLTGTSGSVLVDNLANEGIAGGTMTLKGANVFTGTTTVTNGILNLEGNRTSDSGAIIVGNGAAQTGTLNFKNGNFSTIGAAGIQVGDATGTGIVNHTAGTLSTALGGTGLLLVGSGANSTGTYNLSDGALLARANNNNAFILGANTGSIGEFNLSGTGALTMNAGPSAIFQIGRCFSATATTSSSGTFNQSGGTALFRNIAMGGGTTNSGTISKLNLTGGTFTVNLAFSSLSAGAGSSSEIIIGGTADVTLPAFPTTRGVGSTATLTFDGGTLRPTAASLTYIGGLDSATIQDGGITIDVATGNDILISQPLLTHGTSLGGGLTKAGDGALALSGANTYTGPTNVTAGTLGLDATGSIDAASAVTVAPGATLAGTGTAAGTLSSSGTIAPGILGVGTLTAGPTDLSAGGLAIEVGGSTADKLLSTGAITLSGATLTVTEITPGTAASYVIAEGSSLTGTFATPTLPPGYSVTYTATQAILNLVAGYSGWAAGKGLDGSNNGEDQDPDQDGIANLLEYVLGGLPIGPGSSDPSILPTQTLGATHLVLDFGRSDASEADTTQIVQTSSDLSVWTDFATIGEMSSGPVTITDTGDIDEVSVAIPRNLEVGGKLFARLKVTKTP